MKCATRVSGNNHLPPDVPGGRLPEVGKTGNRPIAYCGCRLKFTYVVAPAVTTIPIRPKFW